MTSPVVPVPEAVASALLSSQNLELVSLRKTQSLWAGYGSIYELTARASGPSLSSEGRQPLALILKLISAPPADVGDEGHLRKMLSYEVEQYFYDELAPRLGVDVAPVARCIASTRRAPVGEGVEDIFRGSAVTIMTDLRLEYPIAGEKRAVLSERQVLAALDWLAGFHGASQEWVPTSFRDFVQPPLMEARRREMEDHHQKQSTWLNGGYTYLATRRKEYAELCQDESSEWSTLLCQPFSSDEAGSPSVAEMAASLLAPSGKPSETYIHGDVKSENLFTTHDGDKAAFYDFQYVGLGFGVCDLAKLFTCSVPLGLLTDSAITREQGMAEAERRLLEYYRSRLVFSGEYPWDEFLRHWETALVDWLRFQASWGFWGNTSWLEARARRIVGDEGWRGWLKKSVDELSAGDERR